MTELTAALLTCAAALSNKVAENVAVYNSPSNILQYGISACNEFVNSFCKSSPFSLKTFFIFLISAFLKV